MLIGKDLLGKIEEKNVYEYTLKNRNGIEIVCLNYGCVITKMMTPDSNGNFENIVIGLENLESYKDNYIYAGVAVGRVAGRIKDAQFELEGQTYTLLSNNGQNHLHGGLKGFHNVVWDADIMESEEQTSIVFSHISVDGEDGYPGTLTMKITYTLNNNNEFIIHYQGQSDKTTLLNPTNHSYFNLSGNLKEDISQHSLQIDSSKFVELTDDMIPTGNLIDVNDTVFDFRMGRKVCDGMNSDDIRTVKVGNGYDHPFVLDGDKKMVVIDEKSRRKLVVETDAAGVVLYTSNFVPENLKIRGGTARKYLGLCLETQGLPDSIHQPSFPSCILAKGNVFSSVTKYTFSTLA